jgi:hypothetical protein
VSDVMDGKLALGLSARNVVMMTAGVLLAISAPLLWITCHAVSGPMELTGVDVFRSNTAFFEILTVPLIGALMFALAVVASRNQWFAPSNTVPKVVGIVLPALALVLAIEGGIRMQFFFADLVGTGFFYNAGPGWYIAVVGALLGLFAATVPPAGDGATA